MTTFLAPYEHVLITCCLSFQVFSWERILFLKSACVNKVMQIQVQTGDTRRLLFVNPPWSVEDFFKKAHILREIPKTRFMDFGALYENDKGKYVVLNDVRMADILLAALVYLLVYFSTYCVPNALLRQNKPLPLIYLGNVQIIMFCLISLGSSSIV